MSSVVFAQAPKTTYNLTMTSYNAEYYAADNDWYCVLMDEDSNGFAFDIVANQIVSGTTYTLNDMIIDYSYAYLNNVRNDYTAASFTYTVSNGTEYVAATVTLDNGDIYNLSYSRVLPVANDTIDVTIPAATLNDYTTSDGVYQMLGYTADQSNYATIVINSNQVVGTYTTSDFNPQYTWLAHMTAIDTTYSDLESGNATVMATATGYTLEAYLLCNDNHCYHLTMIYTAPMATDTVDVVIPNAELNDLTASNGVFQMVGFNADQSRFASVAIYSSSVAGTYTNDNFYANYTYVAYLTAADTNISEFYSGNATVTATANGYALEAYLLCDDEVCYHVTMTYTTSGINTVSNDQVRVYPNPATDMLHVEANGITRIEVIDLAGRIVLSNTQALNTVNVSGLANGVYMLRTTTTEGVNVQKIVKK